MAVIQERQADLEAHRFATTTPTPALVAFLRETLTPRLAAFIAGVTETRATRQWAEGERDIGSTEREQRLRAAAHVTRLITGTFDAHTAQTWEGRYDDPDRTWHTLHLASDAYGA